MGVKTKKTEGNSSKLRKAVLRALQKENNNNNKKQKIKKITFCQHLLHCSEIFTCQNVTAQYI